VSTCWGYGPLYRHSLPLALLVALPNLAPAALTAPTRSLTLGKSMIARSASMGPGLEENLAVIQTMFGEDSRAISTLTRLLQTPYSSDFLYPTPITPALLKLDPTWDSLRDDPGFQKLISEPEPATIYK